MKKVIIAIALFLVIPFALLVPLISAVSSAVAGFYDSESGENFDVGKFTTSKAAMNVKAWYEEYINEYKNTIDERKKEVEKEHTTIEIVKKQKVQEEKNNTRTVDMSRSIQVYKFNDSKFGEITVDEPDKPSTKPRPTKPPSDDKESETKSSESESQESEVPTEPETEQREVCHVNVIVEMDDFPLSAILAYYNVLFTRRQSDEIFIAPTQKDINFMLDKMMDYIEKPDDDSEDYYITVSFKSYSVLPDIVFSEWGLTNKEWSECVEMYLNLTEMVAGWMNEDLTVFDDEEAIDG